MKHIKKVFVITLALGIFFCNVYQVNADLLHRANQLVFLTGSGTPGNFALSSLKRINADNTLTDFIVPNGMVFILNSITISFEATNTMYSYNGKSVIYVNFSIGNFMSTSGAATIYSSSGSYGYYKGTASGSCGMPILSTCWKSLSLTSTLADGNNSSDYGFSNLNIKMSGYITQW